MVNARGDTRAACTMGEFGHLLPHRADTEDRHRRAAERVVAAMREHLDEELSLDEMAKVAYMSPFHLNRVFRQLTGVPPGRFLTALRLETAKRLLISSPLCVTDVSLEVGYSSLGTFTRRFTELVGAPPSRFRSFAASGARAALERLRRQADRPGDDAPKGGVHGRVYAPETFNGPIFVGLFASPVPQGRPVACCVLRGPGPYRITPVPDGEFYLAAVGLKWSLQPGDYLVYDGALRHALLDQPLVVEPGAVESAIDLRLHPPHPLDPPILLSLPLLLAEQRSRHPARHAARRADAAARNPLRPLAAEPERLVQ